MGVAEPEVRDADRRRRASGRAGRHDRRGPDLGARACSAATSTGPRRPPRRSPAAGSTPATWPARTSAASSTSWGARRTSSAAAARTSSAAEVEDVLRSHPKILEAAVIPVPDELRGEEVKAYVLPVDGETRRDAPARGDRRVVRGDGSPVQGAALHRVPGPRVPAHAVDAGEEGGPEGREGRPDGGLVGPRAGAGRPMSSPDPAGRERRAAPC